MPKPRLLRRRWNFSISVPPAKKIKRSISCISGEFQSEDKQIIAHRFAHYYFNRPRTCFVCKQKVLTQGSACQVCRYICHRQCEKQVMTSCVPQANHDVNKHETVNKYQVTREIPISGPATQRQGMSTLHNMMSRSHGQQMDEDQVVLDLVYITERIISMSFPSDAHESKYQFNLHEVMNMLRNKHGENILILNLSEPRDDLQKANNQRVIDYGWPDHLAPPLERMCNICKSLDSWLNSDPNHVIVLHCKGGQGRVALIIAAFMHYSSICASADQALDKFAMKRFLDDKLGGLSYPSHKRYVQYFSGLLSGAIKINSNPLYLHHLVIHGVPNFDTKGGCRPFIKVYQGMQPIFTSGVYHVTDQMQKVCISISPGIPLRGDIMIKCYHKKSKTGQREPIWRCQFHTCAISDYNLIFSKAELDDASNDPRFPGSGKTEFVFGPNQDANVPVSDFKSDVTVPVDDNTDGLVRWDSYENFAHVDGTSSSDDHNSNRQTVRVIHREDYATGPKDGSLYATVNKSKHDYHVTETTVIRNGTPAHVNGSLSPHASSDSGISATSGIIGGTTSPSMSPPYQVNNSGETRHYNYGTTERQHQTYSSSMNRDNTAVHNTTTSPSSTVPKQTLLDEQAKLDTILSDLFSDHVTMSSPKSTSNTMSKETRTFRTYETQTGPDGKPLHQSAEVTYKLPEEREERHYTVKTEKSSYTPTNVFRYTPTSPELARKVENPKTSTLPYRTDYDNRFNSESSYSYNTMNSSRTMSEADSSWLEQQQRKLREKKDAKDEKQVQQEKKFVEELRTAQNRYMTKRQKSEEDERKVMDSYQMPVMNGPTSPGGYNYSVTRTHTYSTDKSPGAYSTGDSSFDSSKSSVTKPPPSPGQTRVVIQPVSAPVTPPIRSSSKEYMQRNRTYSTDTWQSAPKMTRQHSDVTYDRKNEILPPVIKQITITTPPRSPRPFSPTYQTSTYRYNTSKSDTSVKPALESKSYTVDRKYNTLEKDNFSQERISPVQSSFSKSTYKQTETMTKSGDQNFGTGTLPRHEPAKTTVTEIQETTLPEGQKKSHYITEVYVHRTAGGDAPSTTEIANTSSILGWSRTFGTFDRSTSQRTERKETVEQESNRLSELEKSLQAASNSIIASQQPWQQQRTTTGPQGFTQEHIVTRRVETRKYETQHQQQQQQQQQQAVSYSDGPRSASPEWDNVTSHVNVTQIQPAAPPPRQIKTVEEDRFSLRPIGPGVHTLEPESVSSSTGTLNRATTPSFPVSPVASAERLIQSVHEKVRRMSLGSTQDLSATPPFPVSPRTPYMNQASTPTLSPMATSSFAENLSPMATSSYSEKMSATGRDEAYNRIVSRQMCRSSDPMYASIPEDVGGLKAEGTSQVTQKQYNTQQQQQHQQQQHQQQQYQYQYSTSQQQQYHTDSMSQNGGTLHVDTSPKMLSTGSSGTMRSPSSVGSPHSPESLHNLRQQLHVAHNSSSGAIGTGPHSMTGQSSPSVYFGLSRRGSLSSIADAVDATHTTPRFVKDTSKYWYKPHITREDAIALLKDKAPGTFVVRDSNSFPGAFGLALKVATIPPNVQTKSTGDPAADLVRHFLIEPTPKGVRLRGCSNEPVFGSLASLVYQHSITPLALPCKLALPDVETSTEGSTMDSSITTEVPSSAAALLAQGAACNVMYLNSVDTESLTGPQAVSKAIMQTFDQVQQAKQTVVHFKVSNQGITLTDNQRKLFFRRHYPVSAVTYCGMDPEGRKWSRESDIPGVRVEARIFGFVARKQGGVSDNACHLFAELDPEQPASAIVNFVTKIMIGQGKVKS